LHAKSPTFRAAKLKGFTVCFTAGAKWHFGATPGAITCCNSQQKFWGPQQSLYITVSATKTTSTRTVLLSNHTHLNTMWTSKKIQSSSRSLPFHINRCHPISKSSCVNHPQTWSTSCSSQLSALYLADSRQSSHCSI